MSKTKCIEEAKEYQKNDQQYHDISQFKYVSKAFIELVKWLNKRKLF